MDDPLGAIEKLKELVASARNAETEFDRAAIYSAARWLLSDLEQAAEDEGLAVGEALLRYRDGIAVLTGFLPAQQPDGFDGFLLCQRGLETLQDRFSTLEL